MLWVTLLHLGWMKHYENWLINHLAAGTLRLWMLSRTSLEFLMRLEQTNPGIPDRPGTSELGTPPEPSLKARNPSWPSGFKAGLVWFYRALVQAALRWVWFFRLAKGETNRNSVVQWHACWWLLNKNGLPQKGFPFFSRNTEQLRDSVVALSGGCASDVEPGARAPAPSAACWAHGAGDLHSGFHISDARPHCGFPFASRG